MRKLWVQVLFILPAFLTFSIFIVIPIVSSVYYSMTDWNGLDPVINFIGMKTIVPFLMIQRFGLL